MFALQGQAISADPWRVARVAVPLLLYFLLMWGMAFGLAFTAAGNNFELAIAVSIGVWGVTSDQALAGVIGPLIEVPALLVLVLVRVALALRPRFPEPRPGSPGI